MKTEPQQPKLADLDETISLLARGVIAHVESAPCNNFHKSVIYLESAESLMRESPHSVTDEIYNARPLTLVSNDKSDQLKGQGIMV
jgi:hypothetical protein